ncbi:MAG: sigma 54-interacting transcriptional regulator [Deltaproteobacteria bacterium]|nr:sigma 54-interacting transcriptional regulator [Deltaproteobacteria bacterium]
MAHINNVLYTIRNINHLILTENNRDRLIEEACKIFLSPKSYHDAWIVLFDRQGSFMSAAHAGTGEAFAILTTMAKQGEFTYCCKKSLSGDGVMIMKEMTAQCVNCPLTCSNFGRATMVVRLEHNNILYGLLLVSVSAGLAEESEEQLLLANVAGDLAFGLHSIELEINRREAKQNLLESEERYRVLSENVADGVVLIQDEKLKFVNNAFALMFGYERAPDLFGEGLGKLRSTELQEHFSKRSEAETPSKSDKSEFEAKCMTRDGREIWVEARYNIIPWEGRPAILATLRDATESKIRQMAMEEESERLLRENIELRLTMKDRYRFGEIVGRSPAMQKIYELIIKASTSEANVIIYGESGTGKELIARTIHERSNRKDRAFVPVNCGAIPDALFESEFFGYRKGAFTGASSDKPGFFDLAQGGTLFLDELGELAPEHQVKLLRVIDGGGYTPVGDNKVKKTDVRIIGATNRDLSEMIDKGLMREDFFYRIHIIPMTVLPLRYRREDIPLLMDHYMNIYGNGRKLSSIPGKVLEALYEHEWQGNVREQCSRTSERDTALCHARAP